jgi:hypothetical protein
MDLERGTRAALVTRDMMDAPLVESNPRNATNEVVEGALGLVRAELKLLASYAKTIGRSASFSLVLGWLAMTLVQLTLALLVFSPVLFSVRPWPIVVFTLMIALLLSAAAGLGAFWSIRSLRAALGTARSSRDARP